MQIHLRIDESTADLIDEWRSKQRPIPSFNEAVNILAREAVKAYLEKVKKQ